MERELWSALYRIIEETGRAFRQKYVRYQPGTLAAVFVWAVLHDRHPRWACDERHWPAGVPRPRRLPSRGTISRRIERVAMGVFWRAVAERVRGTGDPGLIAAVDGKPLLIGGNSKDPDAAFGRAAGHVGKGYKLHAIWGDRPMPEAWEVTPLNGCEKAAAQRLLDDPATHGGRYLVADGNYDASKVYDAAAAAGRQLLAPCRPAKRPGCGKHYQSPHRLRGLALMRTARGRRVYRYRTGIERHYAHLTGFAGGLQPLPAWVRGRQRVRTWVWAKLMLNGVRIRLKG
jgi:Transposase DDE domain